MDTTKVRIIGLSGKVGTGKTSVANGLCERLPNAARVAFADLLKQEAARIFGFPVKCCYHDKDRLIPLTPERAEAGMTEDMTVRHILQWYGTDVIRARDPEHWVTAMGEKVRAMAAEGAEHIIVDDMRFPNEAECVKGQGGLLVRLEPFPGYEHPASGGQHASETALDDYGNWDCRFYPQRGKEHITATVEQIAKRLQ